VRWWTKALLWFGILLACAGAGALIAYWFPPDPFPPGVRDPGATPTDSPSPSPPALVDWSVTMTSRTTHTYHVGGSCTSDWRLQGRLRISEDGRIRGRGVARLQAGAHCDFPSAQVQARRVVILFRGRREGDALDLRFDEGSVLPAGSQDLGAFLKTLGTLQVSIPERAGADVSERARVEEPEDEIYASVTTVRLRG